MQRAPAADQDRGRDGEGAADAQEGVDRSLPTGKPPVIHPIPPELASSLLEAFPLLQPMVGIIAQHKSRNDVAKR